MNRKKLTNNTYIHLVGKPVQMYGKQIMSLYNHCIEDGPIQLELQNILPKTCYY